MDEGGQRFTLKKEERVSGEKRIAHLFTNGRSFIAYPLRVVYVRHGRENGVSIFVSVPKKRVKSAAKRNRVKRLVRETYRLNKHLLLNGMPSDTALDIAFVYVKGDISDFATLEKGMLKSLREIADDLKRGE